MVAKLNNAHLDKATQQLKTALHHMIEYAPTGRGFVADVVNETLDAINAYSLAIIDVELSARAPARAPIWQPDRPAPSGLNCRGSYMLGTACGKCASCAKERDAMIGALRGAGYRVEL